MSEQEEVQRKIEDVIQRLKPALSESFATPSKFIFTIEIGAKNVTKLSVSKKTQKIGKSISIWRENLL